MKIQIDCYGFEATSEHFQKRKLEAFLIKNENAPASKALGCLSEANPKGRKGPRGIVYACFGTGEMRPIHRIDKDPDGCVRVMWAYGRWEEAEDLAYVPINETIMIKREDRHGNGLSYQRRRVGRRKRLWRRRACLRAGQRSFGSTRWTGRAPRG